MPVTTTAAPLAADATLDRVDLAGRLAHIAHAVTTTVPAEGLAAIRRVADLAEALADLAVDYGVDYTDAKIEGALAAAATHAARGCAVLEGRARARAAALAAARDILLADEDLRDRLTLLSAV